MTAILARIALLLAVLLMPVGMTGASAATAHHATMDMAGMAMGHCSDTGDQRPAHGMPADCTMACASALPAIPASPTKTAAQMPADFGKPGPVRALSGTLLEIATPPPRIA